MAWTDDPSDDGFAGVSKPRCEFCRAPIVPGHPRSFQWTCGWVKPRTKGGANALALAEKEPRWAHEECIDLVKQGINPDQGKLW